MIYYFFRSVFYRGNTRSSFFWEILLGFLWRKYQGFILLGDFTVFFFYGGNTMSSFYWEILLFFNGGNTRSSFYWDILLIFFMEEKPGLHSIGRFYSFLSRKYQGFILLGYFTVFYGGNTRASFYGDNLLIFY